METLRKKWQGKDVVFLVLYTREPHPGIGGFKQTRTLDEKAKLARICRSKYKMGRTVVVDTLDSKYQRAYGGLPNNAYVINKQGIVVYKEAWSNSRSLDRVLGLLQSLKRDSSTKVEFY